MLKYPLNQSNEFKKSTSFQCSKESYVENYSIVHATLLCRNLQAIHMINIMTNKKSAQKNSR